MDFTDNMTPAAKLVHIVTVLLHASYALTQEDVERYAEGFDFVDLNAMELMLRLKGRKFKRGEPASGWVDGELMHWASVRNYKNGELRMSASVRTGYEGDVLMVNVHEDHMPPRSWGVHVVNVLNGLQLGLVYRAESDRGLTASLKYRETSIARLSGKRGRELFLRLFDLGLLDYVEKAVDWDKNVFEPFQKARQLWINQQGD